MNCWKKIITHDHDIKFGKVYEPNPPIHDYVVYVDMIRGDIMVLRKKAYVEMENYKIIVPKEGFILKFKNVKDAKDWIINESDDIQDT